MYLDGMVSGRFLCRLILRVIIVAVALTLLIPLSSVNVNRKLGNEYPKLYYLHGDGIVYADGIPIAYNGNSTSYSGNYTGYSGRYRISYSQRV